VRNVTSVDSVCSSSQAGVRRRFAPHQLRHAHALELAHEGVALNIIQRQLGHANLGTTSIYLQGIDTEEIIAAVREIPHVEIIRIGTRVPVVLPMRIDDELCAMLRRYHPLYINTHFNHPKELTPLARTACERLADAGIPLGNQTVLLRGVNSSVRVMRRLFTELLKVRVRPYYLFQGDVAAGTSHLRTSVETGIEIMQNLRGWISGLAIPHLVIDTPNGMGKVSIGPDYVVARGRDKWTLRNYEGRLVEYPQPAEIDATCPYDEVYFRDEAPAPR